MGLELVITALFLISRVSSLIVPPPENVNVTCQNLNTTVSWNYSKDQPETTFRVNIIGRDGNKAIETENHQYDLSRFVWQSQENYLDLYYVKVIAIQGGNQSEAVSSKTFSFDDLKTVDIKCVLDFPNIEVTSDETQTSVEFQNPLHFYQQLKQAVKTDTRTFKFKVSPVGSAGDFDGECNERQSFCKRDVQFSKGVEQCVRLTGSLYHSSRFPIKFNETKKICATPSDEILYWTAVILGSIFAVIILIVVIAICKVKAWTMQKAKQPVCLTDFNEQNKICKSVSKEKINALNYTSHESLSDLPNTQLPEDTASGSGSSDTEREELLDGCNRRRKEMAESLTCGACGTDDDDAEGSQKTECISVESEDGDEIVASPYDFGHNETIDMGDGDMVTGYHS
ncbi:interferon gamma receptor 1 [Cololabis saira]|uniref:interferon gamma receptor 1 n=1 Tax=Cololabis saira TaxID=129043 RepID=UPI002AD29DD2|nr:interferon gamma receptor 1 [Cololabis saira]